MMNLTVVVRNNVLLRTVQPHVERDLAKYELQIYQVN